MDISIYEAKDDELVLREKIEVKGISASDVEPIHRRVGEKFTLAEVRDLLSKIQPEYKADEPEVYFARTSAQVDGNLMAEEIDISHQTGLKIAVEEILQRFIGKDDIRIEIG